MSDTKTPSAEASELADAIMHYLGMEPSGQDQFAIAADIDAFAASAVLAEREACAKVANDEACPELRGDAFEVRTMWCQIVANKIRARGTP